jgi:hypothetical protein
VDESCSAEVAERRCPTPRYDRALEIVDDATGEVHLCPLGCGRNTCPVCRRRNVLVTAAMHGINAAESSTPPTHAVLSTTRDWADDATMREGWAQFARRVRKQVAPSTEYAWFREWTTGQGLKSDGIRRTHYHSVWTQLDDDQAAAVAEISNDVWGRLTRATSEKAHGSQRVYDAGGLARYIAGLVGHHLKSNQAPPPGWAGRRTGSSRGYYAVDARELRARAKLAARDRALEYRLTLEVIDECPDVLPVEILDDVVTARLEQLQARPRPRVVALPRGWTW